MTLMTLMTQGARAGAKGVVLAPMWEAAKAVLPTC
jgi:hypothetical protein